MGRRNRKKGSIECSYIERNAENETKIKEQEQKIEEIRDVKNETWSERWNTEEIGEGELGILENLKVERTPRRHSETPAL